MREHILYLERCPGGRIAGLVASIALALLLLTAILWGLQPASAAATEAGTLYVDGEHGADSPSCGSLSEPCRTISYTLHSRAAAGDSLLLAMGTYTENLTIPFSVTLRGGYDPADWSQAGMSTIDGSANGLARGDWDGDGVRYPSVVYDNGVYKMWYDGENFDGVKRIGYATSPDGITWTRLVTPVLDVGAAGEWDEAFLEAPFVIQDGPDSYKMWYSGWAHGGDAHIGYATSSDGIHWNKHPGNPVLSPGEEYWNQHGVQHPSVLQGSNGYVMYLLALGENQSGLAPYFAYATSADGVTWEMGANNLILTRTWEDWIWRPFVQGKGGSFRMWYSAYVNEALTTYASSNDGLNWKRWDAPVLTGTAGEWDEGFAADPWVLPDGSGYRMWYDNNEAIGTALSTNGVSWTKPLTSSVFSGGTPTAFGEPVIRVSNDAAKVLLEGLVLRGGAGLSAGGVEAGDAQVTIRNCVIRDNYADGSPNSWGGAGVLGNHLIIEDSWIVDNRVLQGAGGVRVGFGTLAMTNTVVARNQGDFAIHLNGSAALMNVTLAGNQDGLLFNSPLSDTLTIANSILYGNQGAAITAAFTETIQVRYSDIEGGWAGEGNIDLDPSFVDASQDLRLSWDSPCVDAGTDAGAPDHDVEGSPRPLDGNLDGEAISDMGAYELWRDFIKSYLPLVIR